MKYKEKLLGKLAVQSQWITQEQLEECLQLEENLHSKGEENISLIEILIEKNYLTKNQSKILVEEWEKRNQKIEEKIQEWKESEEKHTVICDFCGTQFRLDLEKVQRNLKCGQCGEILPIPEIAHGTSRIQKVKKTLAFLGIAPKNTISIPGYKIQDILEENETWTVYKAVVSSNQKEVLIHALNKDAACDTSFRKKLQDSLQKTLSLEIPNIFRNLGIWEQGELVYVVSEYLEGETLQAILERNQSLSEVKALKIAIRIAKILRAAWDKGILHGDVHPGNIVITSSGKVVLKNLGLPVRLLKNIFYIAQQQDSAPLYLAPEWVSEDIVPDFRSDIYALGSVLYHILAGRPALEGNTPLVLLNFLTEQTSLPPLPFYNASVSKEVCWIIEKMMALDMENRYLSYEDLLKDLENPQQVQKPEEIIQAEILEEEKEGEQEEKVLEESTPLEPKAVTAVKKTPLKDSPTKKVLPKATEEKKTSAPQQDNSWQEESAIKIPVQKTNLRDGLEKNKLRKKQQKNDEVRIINKRNNHGTKIIFALVVLVVIVWYYQKSPKQNRNMRYSYDEEYASIQSYYNENKENEGEWKSIEEKCRTFLKQYSDVDYGSGKKNLTKEVRGILLEIQKIQEESFHRKFQERIQKIEDMIQKEHFIAAFELFSEFPAEQTEEIQKELQSKKEQMNQKLQNKVQEFERFCNQAKESKNPEPEIYNRMEKFLQAFPMHAKENKGSPWDILQRLQASFAELKKIQQDHILEKQKEFQLKSKNAVLELEKILAAYLAEFHFQRAVDNVRHFLRSYEFTPEDRQSLEKKELYLIRLEQAYRVLIKLLEKEKKPRPKVYYDNKLRDFQYANEAEIWLAPNLRISWLKFSKDQIIPLVLSVAQGASSQDFFSLGIFCIYLEDYSLACQYLKNAVDQIKEAKGALDDLEDFLEKKAKGHFKAIEEFLAESKTKEAMQEALALQGSHLGTKDRENHETALTKIFQKLFSTLHEEKTARFMDFSSEEQLPNSVLKYAKANIENGVMKFSRGRFVLSYKEISMIGGLCHFSYSNDRIMVQLLSKNRPKYSFQIRANGNLAYQVYEPGNFKNDAMKEIRNQWLSFALVLNKGNAEWYLNHEKRFSFAIPENLVCDGIEFYVSNTMEDRVTMLDNIYIVTKGE